MQSILSVSPEFHVLSNERERRKGMFCVYRQSMDMKCLGLVTNIFIEMVEITQKTNRTEG